MLKSDRREVWINGEGQVRMSEGGDEGKAAGEGALAWPVARGRTCTRALALACESARVTSRHGAVGARCEGVTG